jgi:hypothetical protein
LTFAADGVLLGHAHAEAAFADLFGNAGPMMVPGCSKSAPGAVLGVEGRPIGCPHH